MKVVVSGLVNIETNVAVKEFPIPYFPIDYPFFGVETSVGGVGYNVAKALKTLEDNVTLLSFTGDDLAARTIRNELEECKIETTYVKNELKSTPQSVALYDKTGKREIYCDLKDIQEHTYKLDSDKIIDEADICVVCNINFNRQLLRTIKAAGKIIATDVHVLSDLNDEYNKDFMEMADILFLSDEAVGNQAHEFIRKMSKMYDAKVIVMGRGKNGVTYYDRSIDEIKDVPAVKTDNIVNTIGAGDALFSAFVHYYGKGMSVSECIDRAQTFAALKIGTNGAANGFVGESEIEKYCTSSNR